MSNRGVYDNAASGDTSFRKTWNREEYAAKAAEREFRERAEAKARYEAKAAGKKYIPVKNEDEALPDDARMIEARRERINLEENLNKTTLVPAGASGGKRGKGAGYYCEACDLNFKNSLEWVEHLNSKQHLSNTGQSNMVETATLAQVQERLRWLKAKKAEKDKAEEFDLQKRLDERAKVEEEERILKKEKKKVKKEELNKKKEAEKQALNSTADVDMDDDAAAMARMMGFGGFGTTKVK